MRRPLSPGRWPRPRRSIRCRRRPVLRATPRTPAVLGERWPRRTLFPRPPRLSESPLPAGDTSGLPERARPGRRRDRFFPRTGKRRSAVFPCWHLRRTGGERGVDRRPAARMPERRQDPAPPTAPPSPATPPCRFRARRHTIPRRAPRFRRRWHRPASGQASACGRPAAPPEARRAMAGVGGALVVAAAVALRAAPAPRMATKHRRSPEMRSPRHRLTGRGETSARRPQFPRQRQRRGS